MHITHFRVENYKSILDSQDQELARGFNVIVGRNNAGKTALLQSLAIPTADVPHRSSKTSPRPNELISTTSRITLSFVLTPDDLLTMLPELGVPWFVPLVEGMNTDDSAHMFEQTLSDDSLELRCLYDNRQWRNVEIVGYGAAYEPRMHFAVTPVVRSRRVQIPRPTKTDSGGSPDGMLGPRLAEACRRRLYCFQAERLNITTSPLHPSPELDTNAANLPAVIHQLQSSNPDRYRRYNEYISRIFPDVHYVTAVPGNGVELRLWQESLRTERDDLAIPLADSGTGTGQVLAMLYVVLTANSPRIILIDEPQSFLHPGAIRKLFEIFAEHPQHQYVIATHSPTALGAVEINRLFALRKDGGETQISVTKTTDATELRHVLGDLGVRLSDVFGADRVLWVEGRTEEEAFPLIWRQLVGRPLLGTIILGVLNVGELIGRDKQRVLQIYRRLVSGHGLLPPAVAFLFDREERSDAERENLQRAFGDLLHFLPRRMFENYLLEPRAIAAVTSSIKEFRKARLTADEITTWLESNRPKPGDHAPTVPWQVDVDGAGLLKGLFTHFSETRVAYDKVRHGVLLTQWLLANEPDHLREIADVLSNLVSEQCAS